jgi:rubrerythrin
MQATGCRHLPIVEGKHLLGFLSIKDLLMIQLKQRSSEVKNLKMLMWAEAIPSDVVEATWRCGECGHTVDGEVPPIRCPKCKSPRVQFTMVQTA